MADEDGARSPRKNMWIQFIKGFERVVVLALMGFLMVVIGLSTLELGWLLIGDLLSARVLLLDVEEMLELFGFFLLVLIGVELLTTLKVHILDGVIHVEVVLEVALTAIAQKIIVLDTSRTQPLTLLSLAALVLALAAAFWWMRSARNASDAARAG